MHPIAQIPGKQNSAALLACGRRGGGGCAPVHEAPLALPGYHATIVERYLSIRPSAAPVPVRIL